MIAHAQWSLIALAAGVGAMIFGAAAVPPPARPVAWGSPSSPVVDQGLSGTVGFDGIRVVNVTVRRYVFIPRVIVVRMGETVHLHVTAVDMPHNFVMPDYDISTALPTNKTRTIELVARGAGIFPFYSTVNGGPVRPPIMTGTVVVLQPTPLAP